MTINFHKRAFTGLILSLCAAPNAAASFLDTDFYCRTYGCVVVHDGQTYDIYDNYNFSTGGLIPVGSQMSSYYNRAQDPNITGTLNTIIGTDPDSDESMMLGITQNGSTISTGVFDDGDGYLDASDSMNAFQLNNLTDVRLNGNGSAYSHSFFISSRNTKFSVRGQANIANVSGDFASSISLSDIKLTSSISTVGNDGGFGYGTRANTSNTTIANSVDDLGDLAGALPTEIIEFGRTAGIRWFNGDIDEQSVRLDLLYTMPQYDLSMGIGSLDIDVVFNFYREP